MYAGFISPKRVIHKVGIHQRLDTAAYKMIRTYLPDTFPDIKAIIHFEGYNGPDGLKTKVGELRPHTKEDQHPSHLYDPLTDTGEVPQHIESHYHALVAALKQGDTIRAAFEASWMAHYVGDGLTPAHHWPLEDKVSEAIERSARDLRNGDANRLSAFLRKNWALWGAKGHMTTHFNFEMGIAFAMLVFPIRPSFNDYELARARQVGPIGYFKGEARDIAGLDLYERFYREGWSNDLATTIKNTLVPQVARTIGMMWLLALLDAGQQLALETEPDA